MGYVTPDPRRGEEEPGPAGSSLELDLELLACPQCRRELHPWEAACPDCGAPPVARAALPSPVAPPPAHLLPPADDELPADDDEAAR